MTLEKIKENQVRLNSQLTSIENDSRQLIQSIVGEFPINEVKDNSNKPCGMVDEIVELQKITDILVDRINYNYQMLLYKTYNQNLETCDSTPTKCNY